MRLIDPAIRDFDVLRAGFRWRIPERYNIGTDVCDRHADGSGRLALLCEDADGHVLQCSFYELRERSNRLANALRSLGVRRGDRVAIILPQRLETAITHIAVYKLGAVALPLSVLFGPDAIEYRLGDSEARLAIVDVERLGLIEEVRPRLPALERVICCGDGTGDHPLGRLLERASPSFAAEPTRADDPAMLIYTSGTTGPPKGALNAHRSLLGNLTGFELSQEHFPQPADRMWTPADWAWTGGLLDALLPALRYGIPVVATGGGRFDPERAFRVMSDHAVRNAFIPPTALRMMMQVPEASRRHRLQLRAVMSAGEQVGAAVVHWGREVLGAPVNEMWGQTEFNYLVGNCSGILPVRPGSMGRPYPGHEVAVIDEAGTVLPPGEVGELAARCGDPVMFLGYWRQEPATRARITGEWFRTGDLGQRDPDGYLWFLGRKDDVICTAGHRVGPGEVEETLVKHPAVAQAAVVGSPDPLRGEIIKAFVVLAAGHHPSEGLVADIQDSVRRRLAAHEYPREVEFLDALPMTTTGKVRRAELRERERRRRRPGGSG
jgi:acetyl-CoA synthetase